MKNLPLLLLMRKVRTRWFDSNVSTRPLTLPDSCPVPVFIFLLDVGE
ncbi:MAG: hypothetical protein ACLUVG_06920 [Phocaeicola vulgatus]